MVPAGQFLHSNLPTSCWYIPDGHTLQSAFVSATKRSPIPLPFHLLELTLTSLRPLLFNTCKPPDHIKSAVSPSDLPNGCVPLSWIHRTVVFVVNVTLNHASST